MDSYLGYIVIVQPDGLANGGVWGMHGPEWIPSYFLNKWMKQLLVIFLKQLFLTEKRLQESSFQGRWLGILFGMCQIIWGGTCIAESLFLFSYLSFCYSHALCFLSTPPDRQPSLSALPFPLFLFWLVSSRLIFFLSQHTNILPAWRTLEKVIERF